MSENSTPEERTEDPTERRMGKLRKEGSIHFSNDLAQVATLITGFIALQYMSGLLFADMKLVLIKSFKLIASSEPFTAHFLNDGMLGLMLMVGPNLVIFSLIIGTIAALAVMLQTKWNVKDKKIDFKLSHLNPLSGLQRIFSIQGLITTGKAILKLSIILPIGYYALKHFAPSMIELVHFGITDILAFTADAMSYIFWKIAYVLIAIAIVDYFWGKHRWLKQNRMTKEEVKDERKSIEGDELTKRKIVAKGLQRIMQRLMKTVPKADVVVTNPTHYSVALQYERSSMSAPKVVAKGKGFMALRIRQIARESGVPVLERKPLARALFASTEVGSQIPNELFRAVAEVLAYVYKIKGKNRPANQQQVAK
jgi:flagellar biosynthetic protein FlhB